VVQTHLLAIAKERCWEGWPTGELEEQVVERSEGLMIWVVAICQYLKGGLNPQKDLEELLDKSIMDDNSDAEEQMDRLYLTILEKCRWRDRRFTESYNGTMGTILAAKVPLTASAIEALHGGTFEVKAIVRFLKPLLLASDDSQPIQILHQSLYDLLIFRAHKADKPSPFAIDVRLHNQQLALFCLKVINAELSEGTPGTGYLDGNERGIPKMLDEAIFEQLWYSCRFWMIHLQDITSPAADIIETLGIFLAQKFILWQEVLVCKGHIQEIDTLFKWINVSVLPVNSKPFSY